MIDVSRHRGVFNPTEWGDRPVHVIGVGATGSKIAVSLAKLGVRNLTVWDADNVEDHNLANQAYRLSDVGSPKVVALKEVVRELTGTIVSTNARMWDDDLQLGEVVFSMMDTMSARRQLFERSKLMFGTKLIIDSRMGADSAHLITYNPLDPNSRRRYEATLFDDDEAHVEVSACGTSITVGPTGDIISGYAVWSFIEYAAGKEVPVEISIGAREPALMLI